jgi:putative DNA methylase
MIPKECKRLAEVDFPIAVVSKHSAREKSIRHGHPSTLHLWWARRPLAACRAMLLALLWPDPCDLNCPEEFKEKARELLPAVQGQPGPANEDLRKALLKFVGDFANWDLSSNPTYLEVSRALVKVAYDGEPPLVVDPFAGGGSIPLEALRVGCEAFASDLNPVACLILKVMLEDIPRHGPGLAEELRRVGHEIKQSAEKELAEFYPIDPDGARPIAYLWARTVKCESPNCGAEIPLIRSLWLCKKANRKRALRYRVVRESKQTPRVEFEMFEPKTEKEVFNGTVARAKATCLCCNTVLPPERVRAQLAEQKGGADVIFDEKGARVGGARLLAVVTAKPGQQGRFYRLSTGSDYQAVWKVRQRLEQMASQRLPNRLSSIPDEPTPAGGGSGAGRAFSVQKYGMMTFGDLFTARQKLAMATLTELTCLHSTNDSVSRPLALALTRSANAGCSLCRWHVTGEKHEGVYSRQALPIVWDFSEGVPLSEATGGYAGAVEWVSNVIGAWPGSGVGQVQCSDAAGSSLPEESVDAWFTDPPYYDAVPYADLSDFFFVWLKRVLPGNSMQDPFDSSNPLTPKTAEAVQNECSLGSDGRPKDRAFYEGAMASAFAGGRRVLKQDAVGTVVFAHKTTEGWEALLSGMVKGGLTITGSWPIATEMASRLRARDSAALATSVHLVCRPRSEDAPVGDWGDVLRELPSRVGEWMERLQSEGVRGADLVFACIGPALEIFSRYSKVETPEGRDVTLSEYLEKVWEVVGRSALERVLGTSEAQARNGAAGALEEDARLTALFLWTLQSSNHVNDDLRFTNDESESMKEGSESSNSKIETRNSTLPDEEDEEDDDEGGSSGGPRGFSLIFDVARRFAQPLGIHLPEWEGRIIETKKGVVRLLSVAERAQQLFGSEGAQAMADRIERTPEGKVQLALFPELEEQRTVRVRGRSQGRHEVSDEALRTRREGTTLDRIHAAMLLQAGGKSNALRTLLKAEQERGPDFLRLANALSALYPRTSEEKRLLDAMLLAVPR